MHPKPNMALSSFILGCFFLAVAQTTDTVSLYVLGGFWLMRSERQDAQYAAWKKEPR